MNNKTSSGRMFLLTKPNMCTQIKWACRKWKIQSEKTGKYL